MIDYIKGIIEDKEEDYITIESSDMGYIVIMPTNCVNNIKLKENIKIYTRLVVREDSLTIYGFSNKDERRLFDLLTSVSSIGPKVGMSILSTLTITEIVKSINDGNNSYLVTVPGIGKKTADRIILELKDKISKYNFNLDLDNISEVSSIISIGDGNPIIEALVSLGYNSFEAKQALSHIDKNLDISTSIKQALKYLGR